MRHTHTTSERGAAIQSRAKWRDRIKSSTIPLQEDIKLPAAIQARHPNRQIKAYKTVYPAGQTAHYVALQQLEENEPIPAR